MTDLIDITQFAATDTSTVKLLSGNDEPLLGSDGKTQLSITVYGPGTRQYAAMQARQNNRAVLRLKKGGKAERTPEQMADETGEDLAALTVSFNGFEYPGHASGVEMFKAAYADRKIGFIAEQVNKHISDWANFTKSSPGS